MNPWPAALQNITALIVTGYLAQTQVIPGQMAGGMILAILGVIAIPALKAPKTGQTMIPPGTTGTLGIVAATVYALASVVSKI